MSRFKKVLFELHQQLTTEFETPRRRKAQGNARIKLTKNHLMSIVRKLIGMTINYRLQRFKARSY